MLGLCDADAGPVPTSVTGDVTYSELAGYPCFADACLCDDNAREFTGRMLACEPVRGGYYWAQGSATIEVLGSDSGECLLDVTREVEAGLLRYSCRLPLPMAAWPGVASRTEGERFPDILIGIEDEHCTFTGSCNLSPGTADSCDDLEEPPFLCAGISPTASLPCDTL